jgi:hypothetical protein
MGCGGEDPARITTGIILLSFHFTDSCVPTLPTDPVLELELERERERERKQRVRTDFRGVPLILTLPLAIYWTRDRV